MNKNIVIDLTEDKTIEEIVAEFEAQYNRIQPWYKKVTKRIKSWF